jgi:mannose-6-phosphate isomerase-like protein (cupin superfamily)
VPKHDPAVLEVLEMTIDAGTQMSANHTHDQSEVYYVAEGKLRLKVGDEEATVDKGSYFYIPAGTPHEFMEIMEKTVLVNVRTPAHAHTHDHSHTSS